MLEGVRKVLHLILLLIIFGFVLAALHTSIPVVPRSAALVIAPEGQLVEQLSSDPLRRAFGQASGGPAPETLLRDVIDAVESAKTDPRIKLIVLDLGNLDSSGLSKLQEIGAALRDFRTAGKRVVVAADSLDQTQYYLAAQAGEVYLDPLGLVYVDGFSYYRMFLKDAIDKLGVDVNVFRAGTFKSFTDQFSRSDMAPSEREESSVWLNSLWNSYTQDVTRARSLKPDALNEYINDAPAALAAVNGDAAKLALQRGLVTALKSRQQLADELKSLVGEDADSHSFNSIAMSQYLAAVRPKRALKSKSDAKVGIVVAAGEILDGKQPPGKIGGDSTADLLRQARYDKAVKAVVLRVDSPGGSMFASELILREVQALRKAGKPVVVSMSTYAASGGYYISAAANQIFASPTTLTGSIGVFSVVPTFQRTLEKLGVKVDGLGTTPLAGNLRLDRAWTPPRARSCKAPSIMPTANSCNAWARGARRAVRTSTRSRRAASGQASMRSASVSWTISEASRMRRMPPRSSPSSAPITAWTISSPSCRFGSNSCCSCASQTLHIGQMAGLIVPPQRPHARSRPAARAGPLDGRAERSPRPLRLLLVHPSPSRPRKVLGAR